MRTDVQESGDDGLISIRYVSRKNVERETSLTEKKETNALLALLAHEIFDQAMDIDASTVDWSAVLAEAGRHKVTALMYPTIRE